MMGGEMYGKIDYRKKNCDYLCLHRKDNNFQHYQIIKVKNKMANMK